MSDYSTLIFIGLPHSGKSSTAKNLSVNGGFKHINIGEILRDVIKNKSDLPAYEEILKVVSDGENVSDSIVVGLIEKKLKSFKNNDIIMDGFPRELNSLPAFYGLMSDCDRNFSKITVCHFIIDEKNSIKLNKKRRREMNLKSDSFDKRYYNFKNKEIPLLSLMKSAHDFLELKFESGEEYNVSLIKERINEY